MTQTPHRLVLQLFIPWALESGSSIHRPAAFHIHGCVVSDIPVVSLSISRTIQYRFGDDLYAETAFVPPGPIVIEGPKACGTTATAHRHAKSEDLLDTDVGAAQTMQVDPRRLLEGEAPHMLDEWQVFPELWNSVRREVDERRIPGQFILAGSATPSDDDARHSGAGRFARIQMRPKSLLE